MSVPTNAPPTPAPFKGHCPARDVASEASATGNGRAGPVTPRRSSSPRSGPAADRRQAAVGIRSDKVSTPVPGFVIPPVPFTTRTTSTVCQSRSPHYWLRVLLAGQRTRSVLVASAAIGVTASVVPYVVRRSSVVPALTDVPAAFVPSALFTVASRHHRCRSCISVRTRQRQRASPCLTSEVPPKSRRLFCVIDPGESSQEGLPHPGRD